MTRSNWQLAEALPPLELCNSTNSTSSLQFNTISNIPSSSSWSCHIPHCRSDKGSRSISIIITISHPKTCWRNCYHCQENKFSILTSIYRPLIMYLVTQSLFIWFRESGGGEVSALDSRSGSHWFKPWLGLEFQGFRIRSFNSTLGR